MRLTSTSGKNCGAPLLGLAKSTYYNTIQRRDQAENHQRDHKIKIPTTTLPSLHLLHLLHLFGPKSSSETQGQK